MESQEHLRKTDSLPYKLMQQLAPIIVSLGVLGGAALWLGKTEFVTKAEAVEAHRELSECQERIKIQVIEHDKTLAVTQTQLQNITDIVKRIDRKLDR